MNEPDQANGRSVRHVERIRRLVFPARHFGVSPQKRHLRGKGGEGEELDLTLPRVHWTVFNVIAPWEGTVEASCSIHFYRVFAVVATGKLLRVFHQNCPEKALN